MTGTADLREIRWLFFDVGNTLVSEETATEVRLRKTVGCLERHGRRCSIEEVRRALQEASVEFAPRRITAAIAKLTDDPDLRRSIEAESRYPKELESPYDGAEQTLRTLSQHYRIGVIANQPAGTAERLAGGCRLSRSVSPPRSWVSRSRTRRFFSLRSPAPNARPQKR